MALARVRMAAAALALPLLLSSAPAVAQEPPPAPPPAKEEIGTELTESENAAFAQLRGSMDAGSETALFDLLDHMPVGPRGAFVSTLLDQAPERRANILAFLTRLDPAERSQIAGLILQPATGDQRQWTNFFAYVGAVSPDVSVPRIFRQFAILVSPESPSPPPPMPVMMQWIWISAKDRTGPGFLSCIASFDPAKCDASFDIPPAPITMGDVARVTPWQVQIYMSDKAGAPYTNVEAATEYKMFGVALSEAQRQHSCGGILIPGNWVLTAAHCIWDDPRFGRFIDERRVRTGTEVLGEGGTTWRITAMVRHAGYNGPKKNDIALLKIAADAQTKVADNAEAHPIALPGSNGSTVPDGSLLVVSGWGATGRTGIGSLAEQKEKKVPSSTLLEAQLTKVPLSTCNDNANFKASHFTVQQGQVCALGDAGRDSCQGDSGGPLVFYGTTVPLTPVTAGKPHVVDLGPTLVGIVSFGPGCGMDNTPGAYTDVAYYRNWILGAMKQAKANQELVWQEGAAAQPFH